jgi:hypothetical protein
MDVTTFATNPPLGSAQPGDLYVDLQSRSLWLGVDPSVNALGSVLISDIEAIQPAINTSLAAAKTYTDQKVALLAPIANPVFTGNARAVTPATADNDTSIATTAFVKSALAADPEINFVTGMIMLWSGALSSIGVGSLAKWHLCDGSAGTPDLRDRFIIGAGNKVPGTKNPSASADTNSTGSHLHVNTGTALTVAQMPSHRHPFSGSGSGSGVTDTEPGHGHPTRMSVGNQSSAQAATTGGLMMWTEGVASYPAHTGAAGNAAGDQIGIAGAHAHAVTVSNIGVSGDTSLVGSGTSHTHAMSNAGTHAHTVSSAELRDALPYYALAYIMKIN